MKRRKQYAIMLAALAVLAAAIAVWQTGSWPVAAEPSPELIRVSEGLDEISITAKLDEKGRSLKVVQALQLVNRTGQNQDAAVLRTWANAFQSVETSPCAAEEDWYSRCYPNGFSSGALVMAHAEANGQSVLYRYMDDAKTDRKSVV